MDSFNFAHAIIYYTIVSLNIVSVMGQDFRFAVCGGQLDAILNGSETKGHINNSTIQDYLWKGPITGLKPEFPRENITALSYPGCLAVCGNYNELRNTRSALEIVTTWIFPLAILFNLPYDSIHKKKITKTCSAVLNWIGSPQTALTQTIFNVRQIRQCHREAKSKGGLFNDAFYVLSCLGQFETPIDEPTARIFYTALVYGLFRPLSNPNRPIDRDQQYTADLLATMAFQLRMLRRRGVIPTLASLGTFLAAFVFSIVLAFANIEDNRTGSPLTLGLLYCWLPLLVVFTVIDRNPVSAERSAILMSRWLFNVNAVMASAGAQQGAQNVQDPTWWTRGDAPDGFDDFKIGSFIGQGRKIQYCGLVDAAIRARDDRDLGHDIDNYESCAEQLLGNLRGTRPHSWFGTALASLLLVWIPVMMAFLIAFFTPTFGLGCWSGTTLLYGILSSFTWVYHLLVKSPGRKERFLCYIFNLVALSWLVFLTILVLIGGFRNCYCSTVQLSYPHLGGYMMFHDFGFYVEHFNMNGPWIIASVIGGLVPGAVFIIAALWWIKCQHLWSTEETGPSSGLELAALGVQADKTWLIA